MAPLLNRALTHRTVDGVPLKVGAEVYFRIGEQNAATGLWRIRHARVAEFVGGQRVRLEPLGTKGRRLTKIRGAVRLCGQLYADADVAGGRTVALKEPPRHAATR